MAAAVIESSPELLNFAKRQLANTTLVAPDNERRSEKRIAVALPARMQQVDSELTPIGQSFEAATRDMSVEGLGVIVDTYLVKGRRFTVTLQVDDQQPCLLVETLWCMPMGPYFYAGFRALQALDATSAGVGSD